MAKDNGKSTDGAGPEEPTARGEKGDPLNGAGKSIEERAGEEPQGTGEEDDGQFALAVEEHGRRVTLSQLYARGTSVKYEFKLGSKSVKGAGNMGLIAFTSPDIMLLVPGRAGKVEVDPTYEADGSIKHVTVRANVKPLTVYDAKDPQAREMVFGEEPAPV